MTTRQIDSAYPTVRRYLILAAKGESSGEVSSVDLVTCAILKLSPFRVVFLVLPHISSVHRCFNNHHIISVQLTTEISLLGLEAGNKLLK